MAESRGRSDKAPSPRIADGIRSPHYRTISVTGVFGSHWNGLVSMTVFEDYLVEPEGWKIDRQDSMFRIGPASAELQPVRNYEARLVMTPEAAAKIGAWLISHAMECGVEFDTEQLAQSPTERESDEP